MNLGDVALLTATAVAAGLAGLLLDPGPTAAVLAVVVACALLADRRRDRDRRCRLLHRLEAESGELLDWDELEDLAQDRTTELRRCQAAVASEQTWRTRLVTSIDDPALLFDQQHERMVAANDAARRLFRIGQRDELGLIQAVGSSALTQAAREATHTGRPVHVDADVGDREVRATASPIGDDVLLLVTDRTEQRRVEELRRSFVVNASHELKTPATAIQTLAEALDIALEDGSGRARGLVSRLHEEAGRLVRLVHDLLDLRRLEEHGHLERSAVDLAQLARDVMARFHSRAEDAGLDIRVDAPEHAVVAGVRQDLELVVANLVANAIQYNQPGGRVAVTITTDDRGYALAVTDTGLGIPRQDHQRVFERFYRVDLARSREQGGTGLGLSIVRHAVERHGGSVQVSSLLGEGSTFRVRLPLEAVD